MVKRKPQDCSHLIKKLEIDLETTNRRLDGWKDRSMPVFRRTVENKQGLERELEHLRHQAANRKSKGSESEEPKNNWYDSPPDIVKRRQIVLQNPGFSAHRLCKVFDGYKVPVPSGWEDELKLPSWVAAYAHKKLRPRIQRIISTDRRQK